MRLVLLSLFLIGTFSRSLAADPALVRIAVISDADCRDLATLITAELSAHPQIQMVERDDLAKVGDEIQVQHLAGTDAAAFGKLVHAEGILFLAKQNQSIQARLTAVGLGYSAFDLQLDAGLAVGEMAKAIDHRVLQLVPKLQLPPGRAIPISLLNLRSQIVTPNATEVDRNLTLLLESRLASIPEYVVLERRHAWDVGFERQLMTTAKPDLLQGIYVLDGTLKLSGAEIQTELRLRLPKSHLETTFQAAGRLDDLPGLVETLVTQITKAIGAPTTSTVWQPEAEAREYLLEGIWAWQHGEPKASVEALDSAELLGEKAPDLTAARIQALCQMAIPDLNPADISSIGAYTVLSIIFEHVNPTKYYSPLLPLPDRLACVKRAMADFETYRDPKGLRSYHLQFIDSRWQHDVQLGCAENFVVHAASSVLAELSQKNDSEFEAFCEQVRQFAGYDPSNGKLPRDTADAAFYADLWSHSQEEEIDYYRRVLTAPKAQGQLNALFLKSRFIWEKGRSFCPRFISDPEEQKRAFIDFAQSLIQTPEGKLSGLVIFSGVKDTALNESSYSAFLTELGNRRVELVQTGELLAHTKAAFQLPQALRDKLGEYGVPVLREYLTHAHEWDLRTLQVLWIPARFPPDQAAAIWSEFKAFQVPILNDPTGRHKDDGEAMFGSFENAFNKVFPEFTKSLHTAPPLSVTRFWQPGLNERMGKFIYFNSGKGYGNTLALRGFGPGENHAPKIYFLNLPDFKTDLVDLPHDVTAYGYDFNEAFLYVTGFDGRPADGKSRLYRFDRGRRMWEGRDVPPGYQPPALIRGHPYLILNSSNSLEPAIARYDWETQNLTILASSRRRPAQNQFDDRRSYVVASLFPAFRDEVGAQIDFQSYLIREGTGAWSPLKQDSTMSLAFRVGDKTLLVDYKHTALFLLDPAKSDLETLILGSAPNKPQVPPEGAARWHVDWPTFRGLFANQNNVGLHGDAFFKLLFYQTAPAHYELTWFDPSREAALSIPLHFEMAPSTQTALKALPVQNTKIVVNPEEDGFPLQMVTTDAGICLWHPSSGVWFIPFAEIEAYVKSSHG